MPEKAGMTAASHTLTAAGTLKTSRMPAIVGMAETVGQCSNDSGKRNSGGDTKSSR
jgi:hypothetical protein